MQKRYFYSIRIKFNVDRIISEIEKEFAQIKRGITEQELRSLLRGILRLINKAQVSLGRKSVALAKLGNDLQNLLDTQVAFNKLNKPVVEKFDDSFFRALEIIKKDLFTLLRQVNDESQH